MQIPKMDLALLHAVGVGDIHDGRMLIEVEK
jgi:hypothetical protein